MGVLHADRRPTTDAMYIYDTKTSTAGNPALTKVTLKGFSGIQGDGTVNLHGISGQKVPGTSVDSPTYRFYINNHRPSLQQDGSLADNTITGANSTVEIFESKLGSDTWNHIRTYADPLIRTPNRVAPVSADSFLFTNDHTTKAGSTVSNGRKVA